MTDRELMQQALEALTAYDGTNGESKRKRVLAALRERLAQPEQEPVAWGVFDGPNLHDTFFTAEDAQYMVRLKGDGSVVQPLYTFLAGKQISQPEQESVAWDVIPDAFNEWWDAADYDDTGNPYRKDTPAYWAWSGWKAASITSPRREWVGLMDDELEMLELKHAPPVHPEFVKDDDWWEFARAIEAKIKEKNA